MSEDDGDQIGGMSQSELQEKRDKWMEEYGLSKETMNGKLTWVMGLFHCISSVPYTPDVQHLPSLILNNKLLISTCDLI